MTVFRVLLSEKRRKYWRCLCLWWPRERLLATVVKKKLKKKMRPTMWEELWIENVLLRQDQEERCFLEFSKRRMWLDADELPCFLALFALLNGLLKCCIGVVIVHTLGIIHQRPPVERNKNRLSRTMFITIKINFRIKTLRVIKRLNLLKTNPRTMLVSNNKLERQTANERRHPKRDEFGLVRRLYTYSPRPSPPPCGL